MARKTKKINPEMTIEITVSEPGRVVVRVPDGHGYLHATDLVGHLETSGCLSVERTGDRTWSLLCRVGTCLGVATRVQKAITADQFDSIIAV